MRPNVVLNRIHSVINWNENLNFGKYQARASEQRTWKVKWEVLIRITDNCSFLPVYVCSRMGFYNLCFLNHCASIVVSQSPSNVVKMNFTRCLQREKGLRNSTRWPIRLTNQLPFWRKGSKMFLKLMIKQFLRFSFIRLKLRWKTDLKKK